MRTLAAAIGLLLSGGCSKEPTFDETFNQHSADIEAKADKMQTELSNQLNAASAAAAPSAATPANSMNAHD